MSDMRITDYKVGFNFPKEVESLMQKRFIAVGEFIEGNHFFLTSYNQKYTFKFDDSGRQEILNLDFCREFKDRHKDIQGSRLVMKKNRLNGGRGTTLAIYNYKGVKLCKKQFTEKARLILKDNGFLTVYSNLSVSLLELFKVPESK